ncbi:MAG TPA: TonB-dependent receptor [Pyrinomonadaceae bacterium]|nr:TonB-dependent receptor [Pyrinomonadaceae bacterium]
MQIGSVKRRASLALFGVVALFALWGCAGSVAAQSSGVSLSGRVLDQFGAAVEGATVTLRRERRNDESTAITDAAGAFTFEQLAAGSYHLRATSRGFALADQEVSIKAGASQSNVELTLQAASLAEAVVVTSSSIAGIPEVVERIPGSVDVLEREMLELSRVFTSSEALRKVSGVNVRDEEGFGLRPNIGIRGLNPTRSTKVLLLEDGIPLTYAPYGDNASYYHPPIDRFESVEVLKGSGQILYGPQTIGGVVNYITRTPPEQTSGSLTLVGGNRDYFNGHADFGGTFGNTGLLFDLTRKQGEGARAQHRTGLSDFNFKSVTALGSRQALTGKFNFYRERSQVSYSGLTEAEYAADPRANPFFNDRFYGDRFGASATHAFVFNANATLTTTLYGSYFRRHWWRQSSNSAQRPNRLNIDPDCRSFADLNTTCGNEGRLRTYHFFGVEPHLNVRHKLFGVRSETDFGVRAHYETQDRLQKNGDLPNSRDGVLAEDNERRNKAYSGFVQNRFLFEKFTVTPGVRVEHIEFQRTNRLANGGSGVSGRTALTQVIPGLGVSYQPAARVTVFAGVHRGFAPPRTEDIINNTTGGSIELDPELSWNYELGFRAAPRRGLRFEATLFRMDYENQIVPASLAGGVGSALTNGGSTLHQGAEFTGRIDSGTLTGSRHNFHLRVAYTFLPTAKFTGTRFSNIAGFTNVRITGNRLPYAPENLVNLNLGYSHPSGVDALVEGVYVGRQFGDDLNLLTPPPGRRDGQLGLVPGYAVWNATVNYHVEQLRSTFFVTAKNLFDRTYIVDRARGILPSSPRLVQAGLKFRF